MDDLSGFEVPADSDSNSDLTVGVLAFLQLIVECYVPFLLANDAAISAGSSEVVVDIWGGEGSGFPRVTHTQPPFKYQQRCLKILREQYAALPTADKAFVDGAIGSANALQGKSRL